MSEKIPVYFIAACQAHALKDPATGQFFPQGTHIGLEISSNQQQEDYYEKGTKVYNQAGSAAFTFACVDGLIGNIKVAHHNGWRDWESHLMEIINRLQEGVKQLNAPQVLEKTISASVQMVGPVDPKEN